MTKYIKKPIPIDAYKYDAYKYDSWKFKDEPDWLRAAINDGRVVVFLDRTNLEIRTLEGTLEVQDGDWILKGVRGEIYPCKPDIFAETYMPVEDKND